MIQDSGKIPEINKNLEPVIIEKEIVKEKGVLEGRSIIKESDQHKKNRLEKLKSKLSETNKQNLEKSKIDVKNQMKQKIGKAKQSNVKNLANIFEKKTKEFEKEETVKKKKKTTEIKNIFREKISKSKKKKIAQEAPGRLEGSETSKKRKGRASLRRYEDSDLKMRTMREKIKRKPLNVYRPQSKTHLIFEKDEGEKSQGHSDLKTKQGINQTLWH